MPASVFDRLESLPKEHGIVFQVLRHKPVARLVVRAVGA